MWQLRGPVCRRPGIQVFYFDDDLARRLRPGILTNEQALEQAKAFARTARDKDGIYIIPDRPYSDPEKAARKLVEIANSIEVVEDGRIHIEKINGRFLFREHGTAGRIQGRPGCGDRRGWLVLHGGTFVRFTQAAPYGRAPCTASRWVIMLARTTSAISLVTTKPTCTSRSGR